jgi:ribosomal protein S27AE
MTRKGGTTLSNPSADEHDTDQKADDERGKEKERNDEETPRGAGDTPTDEHISTEKECPECGAPIENLRASCPKCGYDYKDDDYDEPEAGNEFVAGSNVTDEGEEVTDKGPGVEEGAE